MITYVAEITGHEAPYKWKARRLTEKAPGNQSTHLVAEGSADTYNDALFEASQAAHQSEFQRKHAAAVRTEELFVVEDELSVR